jgi:predicted GNAT superfamily acetyltransferase
MSAKEGIDADIEHYDISEFHLNKNNNYVVHLGKPGSSNLYTNIGRDHLEQLLQKRGQEDQLNLLRKIPKEEAVPEHLSLEEALQKGFQITSYKIRNPDDVDHYVVHVTKGDMSKPYSNIKRDHLARLLKCEPDELGGYEESREYKPMIKGEEPPEEYEEVFHEDAEETTIEPEQSTSLRQGQGFPKHFDEAIESGFEIVDYQIHENNPNYTVVVRQGNNQKKFTNIKAENLATKLGVSPVELQQ